MIGGLHISNSTEQIGRSRGSVSGISPSIRAIIIINRRGCVPESVPTNASIPTVLTTKVNTACQTKQIEFLVADSEVKPVNMMLFVIGMHRRAGSIDWQGRRSDPD
jgi:hypothetical protein